MIQDKNMSEDDLTDHNSVFLLHCMPTGNVISYIFVMHVANKHVNSTAFHYN